MVTVLDESPVTAALQLKPLDHKLVAATPPLRDELRIGHRFPNAVAWRIEDSLDADVAIAGRGLSSLLPWVPAP